MIANPAKFFFVLTGREPLGFHNTNDRKVISQFLDSVPQNCLVSFQDIHEGPDYNALIEAIDIHFLIYENFISTSNRLTKAAHFHRLVIAAKGYCIGEDVQKYSLGETVAPCDEYAALVALESCAKRLLNADLPYDNWHTYSKLNSIDQLRESFGMLIDLLETSTQIN